MNLIIRPETPADILAIRRVNRLAFERENEAQLVDGLRRSRAVILSLVAELGGEIVGHILFSPITVRGGEQQWTAVALRPIAVLPAFQKQGDRLVST